MKLKIPEPSIFYFEEDENNFFRVLYEICPPQQVVRTEQGVLELNVRLPIAKTKFLQLVGVMTRYGLDRSSLRPLLEATRGRSEIHWSLNKDWYWYAAVYGEAEQIRGQIGGKS